MSGQPPKTEQDTTTLLGTFGWIGVTALLAVVAVLLLNWLGPLGGR